MSLEIYYFAVRLLKFKERARRRSSCVISQRAYPRFSLNSTHKSAGPRPCSRGGSTSPESAPHPPPTRIFRKAALWLWVVAGAEPSAAHISIYAHHDIYAHRFYERQSSKGLRAPTGGSVRNPTVCAPCSAQCSSSSAEAPDTPTAPTTRGASSALP